VRVNTCAELTTALNNACDDDSCFQLIEVMLKRGETSVTLARFTSDIKKISAMADE